MTGIELFIWILLVIGWLVFQVVRRILKPPRPLGKIEDEPVPQPQEAPTPWPLPRSVPPQPQPQPQPAPLDVEWGRTPADRVPPPPRVTPPPRVPSPPRMPAPRQAAEVRSAASTDRAGAELALARGIAARQAEQRRAATQPARRRSSYRPRLRTPDDVRAAFVAATILGPCRAFEPYRSPDQQP